MVQSFWHCDKRHKRHAIMKYYCRKSLKQAKIVDFPCELALHFVFQADFLLPGSGTASGPGSACKLMRIQILITKQLSFLPIAASRSHYRMGLRLRSHRYRYSIFSCADTPAIKFFYKYIGTKQIHY